jgi:cytochrome P450
MQGLSVYEIIASLPRSWKRSQLMQVQPIFRTFTLKIILETSFGVSDSVLSSSDFMDQLSVALQVLMNRATQVLPIHKIFKTNDDRTAEYGLKIIKSYVDDLVKGYFVARDECLKDSAKTNPFESTVLENMLLTLEEEGKTKYAKLSGLTLENIKNDFVHLIVAGTDTTSTSMETVLYFLCEHREVLKLAQKEVDAVIGQKADPSKLSGLTFTDFPYLNNVILEALRLYSIAPFVMLEAKNDLPVLGYNMPSGTKILCMNRCASLKCFPFNDPFAFRPERWEGLSVDDFQALSSLVIPFGHGPRVCPGRHLAMLELLYSMASILSHFDIKKFPCDPSIPPVTQETSLTEIITNFYPMFIDRGSLAL